jgi:acylpyruvate hydrolase
MKIIAIGRNYVDHIKELNNAIPSEPVIFSKPETAIIKNNEPFYLPDFSEDVHHEVEILVKISKIGKNIDAKFAHKYYNEIGLGVDFTARDIQSKLKEKGLPWELAKGFDGSAYVSHFLPKTDFQDLSDINFSLQVNGEVRQQGNTSLMMYSIDTIIAFISRYFTLKTGDIIYTGTPSGVGKVNKGDVLTGSIETTKMFEFSVL